MPDQSTSKQPTARRRWWLAVLLQFFGGVGSIYVGRPHRFIVLLVFNLIILAGFYHGYWGAFTNVWVLWIVSAIGVLIVLYYFVDVIRLAIRQQSYPLKWYNRWWLYAGCCLVVLAMSLLTDRSLIQAYAAVRSFSIPAASMSPTIQVGDYVLVDTTAYGVKGPQPGDVAVFRLPAAPGTDYIKRVIGMPGDRITIKDGVVILNDIALKLTKIEDFEDPFGGQATGQYIERNAASREYKILDVGPYSTADNIQELVVPSGHYFVLGDHRDNSTDSRFATVGFIPRENFRGPATGIWWARDWSRIGNLN